ncbi:unnamed protein product [Scytosiphon promiscuus]
MKTSLLLLLVPTIAVGASTVSKCLDPDHRDYQCFLQQEYGLQTLELGYCGITDEDVDSGALALCFEEAGRENIESVWLDGNDLTTLPEGIFQDLPLLIELWLQSNALNTLPEGVFQGLTGLQWLHLQNNALATLPEGIFEGLTISQLYMSSNALTTLPEGIFQDLTFLHLLWLNYNTLTILPKGIFQGVTGINVLHLRSNNLTTLPEGIFQDLTDLDELELDGNFLECLPTTTATSLVVDASIGTECGCSIQNITDNVCGEGIPCTPGAVGYICAAASTPAPEPTLEPTSALQTTLEPTPALQITLEPTPAAIANSTTEQQSSSGGKEKHYCSTSFSQWARSTPFSDMAAPGPESLLFLKPTMCSPVLRRQTGQPTLLTSLYFL